MWVLRPRGGTTVGGHPGPRAARDREARPTELEQARERGVLVSITRELYYLRIRLCFVRLILT